MYNHVSLYRKRFIPDETNYLKDDVIIHRLGADSATDDLIAPCWVRKKMSIVDKIDTFMKDNDIFQADNY